jgi:serine protease Do
MQKFVINLFIFIAIIGKFSFTVASEENINQVKEPVSFADLVEPLLPTVVNIYTIKYNNEKRYKNNHLSKLVPFEEFIHFLKKFNIPISFDLQSSPKTLSLGSGFIIDENGLIVTNHHVIVGSDDIDVIL